MKDIERRLALFFMGLVCFVFMFCILAWFQRIDAHLAALERLAVKAVSHQLYGETRVHVNPDWQLIAPGMLPKIAEERL